MEKIRLFAILALLALTALPVQAKRVNMQKAEKAARSYARTTPRLIARKNFHLSRTVSKPVQRNYPGLRSSGQEEPVYYVFTTNDEGGFIVISGDDAAKPVLGYSDTGTFDESNPNLAYWMETLAQEITAAIENDLPQDAQTRAAWDALDGGNALPSETSGDFVNPLIKTKWNQNAPYNNLCPKQGFQTTLTGCVATAMAQIMNYHKYPLTRTASIPAYTTRTNIYIPAVTGITYYDWNNMSDTYSGTSGTEAQNAVATLMYHCGVSTRMSYDVNGSGAYSTDAVPALKNYFGYDTGIAYHRRDYSSCENWINLLKTELRANRPVYYSGNGGTDGGHAFICDGYDTEDLFHFNWGWSGSSDGYFAVSALYPKTHDSTTGGFNEEQNIITGIQPFAGSNAPSGQLGLLSVSADFDDPDIRIEANLMNPSTAVFKDGYIGVLLYDYNNICRDYYVKKQDFELSAAGGGYYYRLTCRYTYQLPPNLLAGNYKLYPAYGNSPGIPAIIPGNKRNLYIQVAVHTDGSVTLISNVADKPNLSLNSLKPVGNLYSGTTGNFEAAITNSGLADYNSYIGIRFNNSTVTAVPVVIPAGATKTVGFSGAVDLPPGNYPLSVLYDPNNTATSAGLSARLGNNTVVIVRKPLQPAPVGVELSSKTAVNVTLKNIANAKYAKALSADAPAIPDGEWQNTPVFDNLKPNTTYYFFAFYPETDMQSASNASPALRVTTDKAVLGGEVTISGSAVFGETLTAETSKLTATPDIALGILSFRWKCGNEIISDATGNTCKLVLSDIAGSISVTVTAENCLNSISSAATGPVEKATQSAPAAPVAENITTTSITLSAVAGNVLYSRDGAKWQESPVFNDLSPNTEYVFYAKLEESATHKESPASMATFGTKPVENIIDSQIEDMTFTCGNVSGNLCLASTVTDGAALSYQWYGNTVESYTGGIAIAGATDACFTIPDTLAAGTHYYYCTVSATDWAIPVASRVVTVTVLTADEPYTELRLYPNPFTDEVHLEGAKDCTLHIFSPIGLLIHTRKITATDEIIPLQHLRTGVYLFLLDKDKKTKAIWGVRK